MKIQLALCIASLFSQAFAAENETTQVDVYVEPDSFIEEEETYQDWSGPGWYYGIWFDDKYQYYDWIEYHFYDLVWMGPGWYYGIWFDYPDSFEDFRRHHRYYGRHQHRGKQGLHRQEERGRWQRGSQERQRFSGPTHQQRDMSQEQLQEGSSQYPRQRGMPDEQIRQEHRRGPSQHQRQHDQKEKSIHQQKQKGKSKE